MNTLEFLNRVLGSQGLYCLFRVTTEKTAPAQEFFDSVDTLYQRSMELDSRGDVEVYYALATFKDDSTRKADNVQELKSFFLDLDCGEGKQFETKKDAIVSLNAFCKQLGLPKPILVNSGRGVHVYWPLAHPVSREEWLPVAKQLARRCYELEFSVDPKITTDAARVLRMPETHNRKEDEPLQVGILGADFLQVEDSTLASFSELLGVDGTPTMFELPSHAQSISAVNDVLIGNSTSSFRKILDKTVNGKGCAQLARIVSNQDEISEPLWRAGLSIAKFCENSEKVAVNMSCRHPNYSEDETLKKLSQIKGPYLCESFELENPKGCEGCPNKGKIKSPITLGHEIKEATEADNELQVETQQAGQVISTMMRIPAYPKPFFRGKNGGVYIRVKDEDGEPVDEVIYPYDLYVLKRINDRDAGEALVLRLHLPKDGVREFTMPLSSATSKEEFRKVMSMQGVGMLRMDKLMAYVIRWVEDLQARSRAEEANTQFGWLPDNSGFVLGDRLIRAGRIEANHPSVATDQFFRSFDRRGDLDTWKRDVAGFFNGRPEFAMHRFVTCVGFGSPLMQFIPNIAAAALHVYSKDSGYGKTTAMLVGASIWGKPREVVMDAQDTRNSMMLRGEIYKNLPFFIDEVTNARGEQLSNLVYQLSSGRQRNRMSSRANVERTRGEPWSLLSVTTGNASVHEKISAYKEAPKAEIQRILEVNLDKQDYIKKIDDIDDGMGTNSASHTFNLALEQNYGHAGVIFLQYVMANKQAVFDRLIANRDAFDARMKLTNQNRFWSAYMTCVITGAEIAIDLGLIDYDIEDIINFGERVIKTNQQVAGETDVSVDEILNNFINENYANVLEINSEADNRLGNTDLVAPDKTPRGQLVARLEPDTGMLYIVPKALKQWCIAQQVNFQTLTEDLTERYNARRQKVRLGKGTNLNLPPMWVLAFKFNVIDSDEID